MIFVDMIGALLMGTLSGMGIGGGGLLVIYLTLIRKVDQLSAQGLNLYFFIFASVASLFVHATKRNINYNHVLILALFGMPAALVGGRLAQTSDPATLRSAFGYMLIFAGGVSLIRLICAFFAKNKEKEKK